MADLDKLSAQAKNEIALLTSIERAAVLLLLLGEEQAANIIVFCLLERSRQLVHQWSQWLIYRRKRWTTS